MTRERTQSFLSGLFAGSYKAQAAGHLSTADFNSIQQALAINPREYNQEQQALMARAIRAMRQTGGLTNKLGQTLEELHLAQISQWHFEQLTGAPGI